MILETEKRYKQPIRILLYGKECIYEVKSIGDLLPLSFDASAMENKLHRLIFLTLIVETNTLPYMKDLTITAIIKVYQYDELNEGDRSLIKTAMEATARSYSPYSHFSVGAAALLGNGTVVTGTNQENASNDNGSRSPILFTS